MIRSPDVVHAFCEERGIVVGRITALHIAQSMLSPQAIAEDIGCQVRGRNLATGLRTEISFRSRELRDAVRRARPA